MSNSVICSEKNVLLIEGKTKKIWSSGTNMDKVIIESKNDITAFDDPSKTKNFSTKSMCATNTTCRVFELLKASGIPVAYEEQISPIEFLAPMCEMIPLEVIARRYAYGSYTKREPALDRGDGIPYRFSDLKIEFFLKTTKGKLVFKGKTLADGLSPEAGEEDPLIVNPKIATWRLQHSKKPALDSNSSLGRVVFCSDILKNLSEVEQIEDLTRRTFLILESAWLEQGLNLIDFKIEFGRKDDGSLVIADVIDNDSWRLRDENWMELSKESFRQGEDLTLVEEKYAIVSHLVNNFVKK